MDVTRKKSILGLALLIVIIISIYFRLYHSNHVGKIIEQFQLAIHHHTLKRCNTLEGAPDTLPCGMSITPWARLGNLMGEYATLLALAELNGREPVLQPQMSHILESFFHITVRPMHAAELDFWEKRWANVSLNNWMEPRLENLTAPFTFLRGTPSSWTFYNHIKPRILQEFRFRDYVIERTHQTLHRLRNGSMSVTFIGVHVRRTDYVRLMAGRWRGVMADSSFFKEAFAHFDAKYPDAMFLVVSDDMKWCKKNIQSPKDNVRFVGESNSKNAIYDLALLAHCNHSIITMGSFGFWGAYLAGGDTIYYTNYTLPNSKFYNLKYDKWYLPEWIPIAANLSNFVEPPKRKSGKTDKKS